MAENRDSAQERTEPATPKRRLDAKRKGQVARSRELGTASVLLAAALTFIAAGDRMAGDLAQLMSRHFALAADVSATPRESILGFVEAAGGGVLAIAILLATTAVAAIASSALLGGWTFSALAFKWEKLDPLRGIQRMFSLQALMELGKALAKFVLVTGAAIACLYLFHERILGIGWLGLDGAVAESTRVLATVFFLLCAAPLLIAAADVPFQLWNHSRQLRMTKQELKDEMKETDGQPEVKSRIKFLQREIAQRRMMEAVPNADVVVVNPTHFATALRYDARRMAAPVLVAKGTGPVAARIREVAGLNAVPVVRMPVLARSLYFNVKIGQPIPAGLYVAVARTLAYVMDLRERVRAGGDAPPPPEVQVPDSLRADERWPAGVA